MITCPKCSQSLPDWSQNCQFCGADCKAVARPVAPAKKQYAAFQTPKWIWVAYYIIAAWWILGGAYDVMDSFYLFGKPKEIAELGDRAGPNIIGIIFGGLTALFGIGLILKVEIIRGIVNVIAALNLLFGLLGLAGTLMGMTMFGALSIPFVILNIIDIVSAGLLIFIIGETDMKARV